MNYGEAVEYIHSMNWKKIHLNLDRVFELARMMGNPEKGMKFVHIGGTNGKGSVSSLLTAILRVAGYKVGTYTSPDLKRLNERIQIDGLPIPDADFARITEKMRGIIEGMADKPSTFEALTMMGFEYFREQRCDVVVLEVGLGGDLDATNIIREPLVSVITGVDYDHMHILGDNLAEIAEIKAGIIKPGRPVVSGGEAREVLPVFERVAGERGSELFVADYGEIREAEFSLSGSRFDYKGRGGLELSLAGIYQPKNAAVAIETVEVLNKYGFSVSEEALRAGIAAAKWPARFEVLSRAPLVIYDGGHNAQGVRACVESVRKILPGQKLDVVTGILKDKDRAAAISEIGKIARKVYAVEAEDPRALGSEEYAREFREVGIAAEACGKVREGLKRALADARENDAPVLVVGSLHLYAEASDFLKK